MNTQDIDIMTNAEVMAEAAQPALATEPPHTAPASMVPINPGRPITPYYDAQGAQSEEEVERIKEVCHNVDDYELYEMIRMAAKELRRRDYDLTDDYYEWMTIGETLAWNYKELGREIFLDLAANSPESNPEGNNADYDNFLKEEKAADLSRLTDLLKRHGVDLDKLHGLNLPRPFIKHAISVRGLMDAHPDCNLFGYRTIETYMLPCMLQEIIALGRTSEEQDLLLLGSLTTISSMLPNVEGIYGRKRLHPNLYLFVTGSAASGKGAVAPTLELARPLHEMQQKRCEEAIREWKRRKAEKEENLPPCPAYAAHIIPANTTSTAFYRMLHDQHGHGLLFETEADTLSTMLNNKDFGNYSDGLRKAFHHENVQYHRKTDNEYIEIGDPQLSVCLTGTPNQVNRLIDNVENGLFSRFLFYNLAQDQRWSNQFEDADKEPLSDIFYRMGEEMLRRYRYLDALEEPLQFSLTEGQKGEFNVFFDFYQEQISRQLGEDSVACIRRTAISAFRIAMIISVMRMFEQEEAPKEIVCRDCDFYFAMHVAEVLIGHLSKVFSQMGVMPAQQTEMASQTGKEKMVIGMLGNEFSRSDFDRCLVGLGLAESRSRRLLEKLEREGVIEKIGRALYRKTA